MSTKRKVILMGRSGAGKTSMRGIIFSGRVARDCKTLGATIDVDQSDIRFFGEMKMTLLDCGGQASFMNSFLTTGGTRIFAHVHSLIFIFDATSPQFSTQDMHQFQDCLGALRQHAAKDELPAVDDESPFPPPSAGPVVHVLVHKLDLVNPRQATFERRRDEILMRARERDFDTRVFVHGTSIHDETLYGIVAGLIPNVSSIQRHLRVFADASRASEVILLEKNTLLIISRYTSDADEDAHETGWQAQRFDKICQFVKIFRLNCSHVMHANFQALSLRTGGLSAVVDELTPNTYMLVVASTPGVEPGGLELMIRQNRDHFERVQAASWGRL